MLGLAYKFHRDMVVVYVASVVLVSFLLVASELTACVLGGGLCAWRWMFALWAGMFPVMFAASFTLSFRDLNPWSSRIVTGGIGLVIAYVAISVVGLWMGLWFWPRIFENSVVVTSIPLAGWVLLCFTGRFIQGGGPRRVWMMLTGTVTTLKGSVQDVKVFIQAVFTGYVVGVMNAVYWTLGYLSSLVYYYNGQVITTPTSCQPSMVIPLDIFTFDTWGCLMMVTPLRNSLEVAWFFILRSYIWIFTLPSLPVLVCLSEFVRIKQKKSVREWFSDIITWVQDVFREFFRKLSISLYV